MEYFEKQHHIDVVSCMSDRKYLVITNNLSVAKLCEKKKFSTVQFKYMDAAVRDIAFLARESLMNGYCLTADPLAGRLERPTPFLTVILEKKESENENLAYEILRVEYFVKVYCEYQSFFNSLCPQEKQDYSIIDESLTENCLLQMFQGK